MSECTVIALNRSYWHTGLNHTQINSIKYYLYSTFNNKQSQKQLYKNLDGNLIPSEQARGNIMALRRHEEETWDESKTVLMITAAAVLMFKYTVLR